MATVNPRVTTSPPPSAGAAPAAFAAAAPRQARQISADNIDPLTAEALTQQRANPAESLDPPPTVTAESTAAASNSFKSVNAGDGIFDITQVMMTIMQTGFTLQDASRKQEEVNRQAAIKLKFDAAKEKYDAADQTVEKGYVKAAGEALGGVLQGAGTAANKRIVDDQGVQVGDNSGRAKAGLQVGGGLTNAGSTLGQVFYDKELMDHDARGTELQALAESAQAMADRAKDAKDMGGRQISSTQDAMKNALEKDSESRKGIISKL